MKTLEKNQPTPARNLEESPLPHLTQLQQAVANEVAATVEEQKERHLRNPISLEAAQSQVPEELRTRSPLKNG
jgi:hypothetical protein